MLYSNLGPLTKLKIVRSNSTTFGAKERKRESPEQLFEEQAKWPHSIIEKLTELGWGSEIEQIPYRDDLSHHRLVKQPTRLTPRSRLLFTFNCIVDLIRPSLGQYPGRDGQIHATDEVSTP